MAKRSSDSFFVLLGKFTSRRGLSNKDKIAIASLLSLITSVLDFFGEPHIEMLKNYIDNLVLPIEIFANKLIEIPKLISEYVDVKKENESLKLEIDALKIKTIIATGIEKELEELRKAVNLKYQSNLFNAMEKVLGFEKSIFNSHILISSTQNQTKENSVVITPEGLVGLVIKTSGKTAKVLSITNQKISIPVRTETGEHLIISGTDKNEMISREIKSNTVSELNIGDILYTSGEGGIFKENIPVAKITEINEQKNEITAKPIVEMSKLNFVWIVEGIA